MTESALKRSKQAEEYQNVAMNDYTTNAINQASPDDKVFVAADKELNDDSSEDHPRSTEQSNQMYISSHKHSQENQFNSQTSLSNLQPMSHLAS